MPHTKRPAPSISFACIPNDYSLPISLVVLIIPLKISAVRPIKLALTMKLILFPFTFIYFAIRPNI